MHTCVRVHVFVCASACVCVLKTRWQRIYIGFSWHTSHTFATTKMHIYIHQQRPLLDLQCQQVSLTGLFSCIEVSFRMKISFTEVSFGKKVSFTGLFWHILACSETTKICIHINRVHSSVCRIQGP